MKLRPFLFALIAVFSSVQLFSQTIEGTVINAQTNAPINGANISVENSTIGTVTDSEGRFTIEIPKIESKVLTISFVGFKTEELNLDEEISSN
jgi:hypothetical protein